MAATDHNAPAAALRARIDERFFAPFKRTTFVRRTWFVVSVGAVLALHAGVIGYFLYRDAAQPTAIASQEETPVEIVVEPPPPPPPPPPQQQAQKQQQEIEKPASSAPRAESDTKIDTDKTDSETHAPKAAAPAQDGQPAPSKDAEKPDTDTAQPEDTAEAAPKPDVLKKDEEALDQAAPAPKVDKAKAQKAKLAAARQKHALAAKQMAGLSDLPDYKFAKQTKKSLVSGGTEDSRYLAIVYGLITQSVRPVGEGSVTVAFELDSDGEVVGIELTHSSGDELADAEVVNAVRRISPFPPPPPDRPHSLTATINFASAGRPLTMGDR